MKHGKIVCKRLSLSTSKPARSSSLTAICSQHHASPISNSHKIQSTACLKMRFVSSSVLSVLTQMVILNFFKDSTFVCEPLVCMPVYHFIKFSRPILPSESFLEYSILLLNVFLFSVGCINDVYLLLCCCRARGDIVCTYRWCKLGSDRQQKRGKQHTHNQNYDINLQNMLSDRQQ